MGDSSARYVVVDEFAQYMSQMLSHDSKWTRHLGEAAHMTSADAVAAILLIQGRNEGRWASNLRVVEVKP